MRKIIVVAVAALMMVSCAKKYGNFAVKGKILNAPANQTLYVLQASFGNQKSVASDSVKLKPTGEYELKGTGTEEGLYLLALGQSPIAIFVNDGSTINI